MIGPKRTAQPDAPLPAPTSADTLATIRRDIDAARAAVPVVEEAYRVARLKADIEQDNGLSYSAMEMAAKVVKGAWDRLARLTAQLQDAEHRASPEYVQKWRAAEVALKKRAEHARKIQDLAQALFKEWEGWHSCNRHILGLAIIHDQDGACIRDLDTVAMFKLELARAGFAWAAKVGMMNPSTDIPPLTQRVEDANFHALGQRKP